MATLPQAIQGYGTCSLACWEAHEDVCRCQCIGQNHGIMRQGGAQPERTRRKGKYLYRLVAVHVGAHVWSHAERQAMSIIATYPTVRRWDYDYADKDAAFSQSVPLKDGHQLRWPEVQNLLHNLDGLKAYDSPGVYLVWERITA